jgi:hypothetical protein
MGFLIGEGKADTCDITSGEVDADGQCHKTKYENIKVARSGQCFTGPITKTEYFSVLRSTTFPALIPVSWGKGICMEGCGRSEGPPLLESYII